MNRFKRQFAKIIVIGLSALALALSLPGADAYAAKRMVKSIKITNVTSGQGMVVKKGLRLKVKTKPYVSIKRLSFRSSNKRIATVSQKGYVKAKKVGTVYITVRSKDRKKKQTRIRLRVYKPVKFVSVTSSLRHPYVQRGSETNLTCKVSPAKACQKVKWSSSDNRIATVNSKGEVTALANGNATITAKVADGVGKKAKYTITVGTLSNVANQSIGHRGYSSIAPENTKAAFDLGINAHFGGLECDVRQTQDGVFVISHDDSLLRIFGVDQSISQSDYEDIRNLVAVGGKGVKNYPNERILTLQDYMGILQNSHKKAVIELKSGATHSQEDTDKLYEMISDYQMNDRVEIISFSQEELGRITQAIETNKEQVPVAPKIFYLTDDPTTASVQWALSQGYGVSVTWSKITADIVKQVHAANQPISAWTVDQFDTAYYLKNVLGVDRITSNVDLYGE